MIDKSGVAGVQARMGTAVVAALLGGSLTAATILTIARPVYASALAFLPALALAWAAHRGYRRSIERGLERMDAVMRAHNSALEALSVAIDAKDPLTQGHVRKVQAYSLELARRMRVPAREMHALRTAALLHDIGKLAIPDHLLNKPGRLTDIEFQKVKAHPAIAAEILASVEFPYPVLPIIRHHHERWDGSGYPDGLRGAKIPLGARILAVADTFEALTSDRVYRSRKPPEEACALIEAWAGIHYDPRVARALRENLASVVAAALPAPGLAEADGLAEYGRAGSSMAGGDTAASESLVPVGESGATEEFGAIALRGSPARGADEDPRRPSVVSGLSQLGGAAGFASALSNISSAQREVYALYEIAQTLGSSLRLAEVLDLVVSKIGQLVPYRTCACYLLDTTGETLSARFVSGAHAAELRGRAVRLGEGITGWAAAHRSPRFSTSPELDLAGTEIEPAEFSTAAAFPLCHDASVLGVITLYYPKGLPCLDDHIRMMDIIAKLAAGAVFNSTLFAESQESALTDDLTNLPNSRYLRQVFEQETIKSQQAGQPMAFLEMDLDNFKAINDRFGHQAGDRFLTEVSRVLRSHLRERDILVRLSGDEFAAILPMTGFAAAALLAERLQQAVDAFSLRLEEGKAARSGLSIGISLYPEDGESFEHLIARADHNMYRNKESRKSQRADGTPNVIPFPIPSPGRS